MSGFLKTLFGDTGTMTVVLIVLATEIVLVAASLTAAGFMVPPLVLAGTAWLARR